MTDATRRQRMYAGEVFLYTERPSTLALCDHAWELIREAFDPIDPGQAQDLLPVEKFVEILSGLKTAFCHHPTSKQLLGGVLDDLGCELGSRRPRST